MRNFIQNGEVLTVTAPRTLLGGQGALVGSMFGVATSDAANGAPVELFVGYGVVSLTALNTDTGTVGTKVYWDNTAFRVTTTVGTNTYIGVLAAAKANGDTTATVRLNGTVA